MPTFPPTSPSLVSPQVDCISKLLWSITFMFYATFNSHSPDTDFSIHLSIYGKSYYRCGCKEELKGDTFLISCLFPVSCQWLCTWMITCWDWTFLVSIFLPWQLGRYRSVPFYSDLSVLSLRSATFHSYRKKWILSCPLQNPLALNSSKFLWLCADDSIATVFLVHSGLAICLILPLFHEFFFYYSFEYLSLCFLFRIVTYTRRVSFGFRTLIYFQIL